MLIEGKTKTVQDIEDGYLSNKHLVRITTKNSLTANDAIKQEDMPLAEDKTTQTVNIFKLLEKYNIPNAYYIQTSPISFSAKKCAMLPLECVIRRRPFGSYLKRQPQKVSTEIFDPPLLEFFHKHTVVVQDETTLISENEARELYLRNGEWTHEVYTDPLIEIKDKNMWSLYPPKSPKNEMLSLMDIKPVIDEDSLEYIKQSLMIPCFETIEKAWKKFNVDLIDMKIEVGINHEKELVIADVIDNDSWRIWPNGDPKQQLDKQSFRDGEELSEVQRKYKIVTEYVKNFNN